MKHIYLKSISIILAILSTMAMAKTPDWSLLQLSDGAKIKDIITEKKAGTDISSFAELGMLYYDLAQQGDKDAITQAYDYFTQYIEQQPQPEPIILALLGSSKAMKARETDVIGDKVKFVNQGIGDLNEAVMLAPENIQIRLIRIRVFSQLPKMFKKKDTVLEDIAFLLDGNKIQDKAILREIREISNSLH